MFQEALCEAFCGSRLPGTEIGALSDEKLCPLGKRPELRPQPVDLGGSLEEMLACDDAVMEQQAPCDGVSGACGSEEA